MRMHRIGCYFRRSHQLIDCSRIVYRSALFMPSAMGLLIKPYFRTNCLDVNGSYDPDMRGLTIPIFINAAWSFVPYVSLPIYPFRSCPRNSEGTYTSCEAPVDLVASDFRMRIVPGWGPREDIHHYPISHLLIHDWGWEWGTHN